MLLREGRALIGALLALLAGGCLFDPDNRCGDAFVVNERLTCECPEGSVLVGRTCEECGKNQVARNGECVCRDGFTQRGDGCSAAAEGLGDTCSDSGDCVGEEAPFCAQPDDGGDGFCTASGCEASSDCDNGYVCNIFADPSYCEPLPDGYGDTCTSNADCSTDGADFCDTFQSRTCIVSGCDTDGVCPGDWVCCNYAIINAALCVPQDGLEDGSCPAPGELVERQD